LKDYLTIIYGEEVLLCFAPVTAPYIIKLNSFYNSSSARGHIISFITLFVSGKSMSSSESQEPTLSSEGSETISKKAAKKELAKLEKQRRREVAAATSATSTLSVEDDPLAVNYGIVPLIELQSKTPVNVNDWTRVEALNNSLENKPVLIRGRAQAIRPVGKKMAFLVIRENGFTVQCLVQAQPDLVSPQMVKFAAALSRESIIDVEGVVSIPAAPIKGATQQVGFDLLLLRFCDFVVFWI